MTKAIAALAALTILVAVSDASGRTRHRYQAPNYNNDAGNPSLPSEKTFRNYAGEPVSRGELGGPGRHREEARITHQRPARGFGLVTVATSAGPITVAAAISAKMAGFVNDVWARGFRGRVHCYAASGHVPGSLHHIGRACDFAQTGWNRTHAVMYRVADLTSKWDLRNGCDFRRRRDCGHIDDGFNGGLTTARSYRSRHRYAMR